MLISPRWRGERQVLRQLRVVLPAFRQRRRYHAPAPEIAGLSETIAGKSPVRFREDSRPLQRTTPLTYSGPTASVETAVQFRAQRSNQRVAFVRHRVQAALHFSEPVGLREILL